MVVGMMERGGAIQRMRIRAGVCDRAAAMAWQCKNQNPRNHAAARTPRLSTAQILEEGVIIYERHVPHRCQH
jgi:hypothetical protein